MTVQFKTSFRLIPTGAVIGKMDVVYPMFAFPNRNVGTTAPDIQSVLYFINQVETWTYVAQKAYQSAMIHHADMDTDEFYKTYPASPTGYAIPMQKGKTMLVTRHSSAEASADGFVRLTFAELVQSPSGDLHQELTSYARHFLTEAGLRFKTVMSNESDRSWAELINFNLNTHITHEQMFTASGHRNDETEIKLISHAQFVGAVQRNAQRQTVGGMVPISQILGELVAGFKSSAIAELQDQGVSSDTWEDQWRDMFDTRDVPDFRLLSGFCLRGPTLGSFQAIETIGWSHLFAITDRHYHFDGSIWDTLGKISVPDLIDWLHPGDMVIVHPSDEEQE